MKGTYFSFHAIKNVTCAEGGLVVTDDDELANRVRCLKFHGLGVDAFDRQVQGRKPQAKSLNLVINIISRISRSIKSLETEMNARLVALYRKTSRSGNVMPEYPHLLINHLFMVELIKMPVYRS